MLTYLHICFPQLLSPEDLLNACKLLPTLNLPVTLHTYETGVKVLQLRSSDDESLAAETATLVSSRYVRGAQFLPSGIILCAYKEIKSPNPKKTLRPHTPKPQSHEK